MEKKYRVHYDTITIHDESIVCITWKYIGDRFGQALLKNGRISVFTYPMTILEQETFKAMEQYGETKNIVPCFKTYYID